MSIDFNSINNDLLIVALIVLILLILGVVALIKIISLKNLNKNLQNELLTLNENYQSLYKQNNDHEQELLALQEAKHQVELNLAAQGSEIKQQDQFIDSLNVQINDLKNLLDKERENSKNKIVELEALRVTNNHLQEQCLNEAKHIDELYQSFLEKLTNVTNKVVNEGRKELQDQNKISMENIVNPVKEKIEQFQLLITQINNDNTKQRAELNNSINLLNDSQNKLKGEAEKLANALHYEKKQQGMWGELVLQNILDAWGLRENQDYIREFAVKGSESAIGEAQRPDFIINLPDNRHLIIDAKCPINAYRDYVNSDDPNLKKDKLKELVKNIKARIDELAKRQYQNIKTLNAPQFVFLFIPIEPAYIVATSQDPNLNSYAFERNIALTTSSTIMAALFITKQMWVMERQSENVEKVKALLIPLCTELKKFKEQYATLGDKIIQLQKVYDQGKATLLEKRGNIDKQSDNILENFA